MQWHIIPPVEGGAGRSLKLTALSIRPKWYSTKNRNKKQKTKPVSRGNVESTEEDTQS